MDWNPRISTMREEWEDMDVENTISALREVADENQRDLDSRSYQRDFSRTYQESPVYEGSGGSFYLRTTLCLLIFCGFLWVKKENRSILGVAPENVREVISQSIILQDVPDSVKIEWTNP